MFYFLQSNSYMIFFGYFQVSLQGMEKEKVVLVVDAGNTRIKVALYQGTQLAEIHFFNNEELAALKSFFLDVRFHEAIVSSVRNSKQTQWILQLLQGAKLFNSLSHFPVEISYQTPETLGADRLANAIGAYANAKGNCLVVDIGTCIKFDFVNQAGVYLGGSISPGIQLRYKAMHQFTGALPLVENTDPAKLIGQSTVECMHIGVIRGIDREIRAFISDYEAEYQDLTIFVTGGDAQHFDFGSKNNIFVDENLTLTGLFITLQTHAN